MNEDGSEFGVWSGIGVRAFCAVCTMYSVRRPSYAAATEWTIASQEIDICQLHLTVAG